MKKITIICLAFAFLWAGCKRVNVDFTYSPTEPRAGQAVKFNNLTNEGEDWNWDFGDKAYSVVKNPSHTFKKAGTYVVTLMVDSANYNTCSHTVTVYDTIPTFVCSTDSICHYTDVVFTANVYNPYAYKLTYQWELPESCVLVAGDLQDKSISVYFKEYNTAYPISLTITQNDKVYPIQRTLHVYETKAPAIVMEMVDNTVLHQRMINDYLEDPANASTEDVHMLELYSDTSVTFNSVTFYASNMHDIFPNHNILRLQIDPMAQKWYFITNEGLFVANFNGDNIVALDTEATGGLYVDMQRNKIYWATNSGLKAMPLIKSKNNQFATTPALYNTISTIDRIVVNNSYH